MQNPVIKSSLGVLALLALSACGEVMSNVPADTKTALLGTTTPNAFTQTCTEQGGKIAQQSCQGHNSCAGVYFNNSNNKAAESSCKGHNTCAGLKCDF